MSRILYFAYPGDLEIRTGGYGYDRRILHALGKRGWKVEALPLGENFPQPDEHALAHATRMLETVPDEAFLLIDGLAYGVMPEVAQVLSARLKLVALIHHPLAREGHLEPLVKERLERSETEALKHAHAVVVTSPATKRQLAAEFGVDESRIAIALPGTDPGIQASGSPDGVPHILAIGTIIRRKGHDVLVEALAENADLEWTCRIIGNRSVDAAFTQELEDRIGRLGLSGRISLTGQVDDTRGELPAADIFALATYYEGYGMVFAEAMAHGLPIVATRAGAIPDVVPQEAGILVEPGNAAAFGQALRRLLQDRELRTGLAAGSRRHGATLPGWDETAATIEKVLETIT
ncbi:glycosyltransferase family 4 protein [Limoniibacter endophyticus]|uniref:Glycosyl hydrolase n=1 Tax=Limoniibacter endophyticus TaxID=1565040 RepID=A0A8J3GGJ4_9HYPH|nr:glycosyltransferase family 4 protein [Limoniibacter endophyticus]GHC69115.1 glycosyl hydrolase [Limoniibacter endophyticus]